MATIKCDIEIPEKIIQCLGLNRNALNEALKIELAAHFFEKNMLSFGQAREFSNLSVWDFIDFLREKKIPIHYSIDEYEEDKALIEEMTKCQ